MMRLTMMVNQCKAECLRVFRNPYYIFWSLVMPLAFYVIFTRIANTDIADARQWQAHYLMSMAAFSVMGSAIMTLGIRLVQERTQGWTTFMRLTPMPGSVYFFSKMFGQTMIHLFTILFIFIAGFLINGVSLALWQWLGCGLWIWLGSIPFLAIGTLVGTMKRTDTASGVSNMLYLLLAIGGGMWIPLDNMPVLIQHIGEWLPSYSFGNGAWSIVSGSGIQWMNAGILILYLIVFMLLAVYFQKKQQAV